MWGISVEPQSVKPPVPHCTVDFDLGLNACGTVTVWVPQQHILFDSQARLFIAFYCYIQK